MKEIRTIRKKQKKKIVENKSLLQKEFDSDSEGMNTCDDVCIFANINAENKLHSSNVKKSRERGREECTHII